MAKQTNTCFQFLNTLLLLTRDITNIYNITTADYKGMFYTDIFGEYMYTLMHSRGGL